MAKNIYKIGKELVITNDEAIKEGDYIYNLKTNRVDKATFSLNSKSISKLNWRKIILTADIDLIKDGVQAIDDEFLEWFVKNPNCEEVEIKEDKCGWCVNGGKDIEYRKYNYIEIPKEEPKQEQIQENHYDRNSLSYSVIKEETLEEFALKTYPDRESFLDRFKDIERKAFIAGAKWQAERMYGEEDMIEFSQWVSHNDWVYLPSKKYWVNEEQEELEQKLSSEEILNLWFKQFKKK